MPTAKQKKDRAERWLGMNWIRQVKRLAIYMRDGMACVWCGAGVETGVVLSLDHLIPARGRHGADNGERNLVTCCVSCNMKRGKRSMLGFADLIAAETGQDSREVLRRIQRHRDRVLKKYLRQAEVQIAERGSVAKVVGSIRESA